MQKKSLNKTHPHKSVQRPSQSIRAESSEIDRIIWVELDSSTASQPSQHDSEKIVEIMRAELRCSFWQNVALGLFIFILGLFATILIILLQR